MADKKEEPTGSQWKDPAQAVAFATLILISGGIDITEENIGKLLNAAKCEVNASIPRTYERAVKKGMDLKDLIDNFGKGGPIASTDGAPKPEESKGVEEEPESEDKSSSKAGPGLFGDDSSSNDDSSSD
eukprot:134180_1